MQHITIVYKRSDDFSKKMAVELSEDIKTCGQIMIPLSDLSHAARLYLLESRSKIGTVAMYPTFYTGSADLDICCDSLNPSYREISAAFDEYLVTKITTKK